MDASVKPGLKVVGLYVDGLKALRRVRWPEDGMGWGGEVPDEVMVGGVNGSGKTTLLELISGAVSVVQNLSWSPPEGTWNAWIDLRLASAATGEATVRVLAGDGDFVQAHQTSDCFSLVRGHRRQWAGSALQRTQALLTNTKAFAASDFPGVIYLPTDRQLVIPDEKYKAAGKLAAPVEFQYRFRPAEQWNESLEAILYAARWADLNAREAGRPEDAWHFESHAAAFQAFFGGARRLVWTVDGELLVEVADTGARHPLLDLGSGEKQALILAAELYRRWRPGSLVLIDEPELHFHTSWQTTLWQLLTRWRKERGGQVIVTTQSNHLFRIGEPGTKVLLGATELP